MLSSSQIICQIFLASLLSSRSKCSAQSWTSNFLLVRLFTSIFTGTPLRLYNRRWWWRLTRDTLAFSRRERTARRRRRWCWWALHTPGVHALYNRPQQRSYSRRFKSKIGGKIYREKWCLKPLILIRSSVHVEHLNFFSWFSCAFTVRQFSLVNTQLTCLMNFCFL